MSQHLIEKIQAARLQQVEAGGITFTVRRPTELEVTELDGREPTLREMFQRYVVDWNAKEIDLIAGGTPKPVPFSPALFEAWVEDKPQVWKPLTKAIIEGYKAHRANLEAELGKLDAG